MFKSTITFSQLKSNSDHLTSLQSREVLQVLHRGSEVKVVMTQEYYFYLLAMMERNNFTRVTPHDEDAMRADIAKRTAEDNGIVIGYDPNTSFGPIASDYNQSTNLVDSMNGAIGETENDVDLVSDQLLKKSFWK